MNTDQQTAQRFHIFAVNRATQREVRITLISVTKGEAERMAAKVSRHPQCAIELRPVS